MRKTIFISIIAITALAGCRSRQTASDFSENIRTITSDSARLSLRQHCAVADTQLRAASLLRLQSRRQMDFVEEGGSAIIYPDGKMEFYGITGIAGKDSAEKRQSLCRSAQSEDSSLAVDSGATAASEASRATMRRKEITKASRINRMAAFGIILVMACIIIGIWRRLKH